MVTNRNPSSLPSCALPCPGPGGRLQPPPPASRPQKACPGAKHPSAATCGARAAGCGARTEERAAGAAVAEEGPEPGARPKVAPSSSGCHLTEPCAGAKAAPLDRVLPLPGLGSAAGTPASPPLPGTTPAAELPRAVRRPPGSRSGAHGRGARSWPGGEWPECTSGRSAPGWRASVHLGSAAVPC
nr:small membrane A-kinase anchor protein isoform X1 [Oryctolagus cuniculus]